MLSAGKEWRWILAKWSQLQSGPRQQASKRFLCFAKFYRRFNYSTVTAPLTFLLRSKPWRLKWSTPDQTTFKDFKWVVHLSSHLATPWHQCPVRCGGGCIQLWHRESAFTWTRHARLFLQKLTKAENNYDVGNRELLSIKEALAGPHQAQWALFFTRFHFTILAQRTAKLTPSSIVLSLLTSPWFLPTPWSVCSSRLTSKMIQWVRWSVVCSLVVKLPLLDPCVRPFKPQLLSCI